MKTPTAALLLSIWSTLQLTGHAFVLPTASSCLPVQRQRSVVVPLTPPALASATSPMDEDDDREFVRVRRGGRRKRRLYRDDDDEDFDKMEEEDYPSLRDDSDSTTASNQRRRERHRESAYYDEDEDLDEIDYDRLEGLLDDDEADERYACDDEEEYDLMSNVLIPNPLLDSMDPDGAAERFPELAADPRFWFDMVLFVAFLNFLSFVGPQDPFPDIPWS